MFLKFSIILILIIKMYSPIITSNTKVCSLNNTHTSFFYNSFIIITNFDKLSSLNFRSCSSQFNFTTFNTIVIDYFVNGKKRLFLVEGFLKLEENQELKGFLQVLFKVFDISLPFVLKYEYLDELIDASGFTLQVSDKSILELSKEITFNGSGRIKGTHFYYQAHFLDDENIIVCSPMMLVHLGERYFHVQKFCS